MTTTTEKLTRDLEVTDQSHVLSRCDLQVKISLVNDLTTVVLAVKVFLA